jgi:hypothetical protein
MKWLVRFWSTALRSATTSVATFCNELCGVSSVFWLVNFVGLPQMFKLCGSHFAHLAHTSIARATGKWCFIDIIAASFHAAIAFVLCETHDGLLPAFCSHVAKGGNHHPKSLAMMMMMLHQSRHGRQENHATNHARCA